jgi:hypothetical protein
MNAKAKGDLCQESQSEFVCLHSVVKGMAESSLEASKWEFSLRQKIIGVL